MLEPDAAEPVSESGTVPYPLTVCRGCNQSLGQCHCDGADCPNCLAKGHLVDCIDDICHARGDCLHGDNRTCPECHGTGFVMPERVLVVPDEDALAIRDYLRDHPELQPDEYRTSEDEDPLLGLCYPAAEAYYHVRDCDLEVYCLSWSDVDDELDGTHWYLRDPEADQWVDIALPLMPPVDLPPFEAGTHRGFLTGDEPSARGQEVLDALDSGEEVE